jgi:hypothetical protein
VKGVAFREMIAHIGAQAGKRGWRHRLIDAAPPDFVRKRAILHDVLVFGRAASVFAGVDHQRATVGEYAFLAPDRVLDQCG